MTRKSLLLVAVVVATVTRKAGAQNKKHCSTCHGPMHSWDTVPVSFHSSKQNTHGPTGMEFSQKDLEVLSKFPLVTLEKWQGMDAFSSTVCNTTGNCNSTNAFVWQEDAWIAAATQIKEKSPNTSVVVWMDTVLIYTGWFWPPKKWHKHTPRPVNRTLNPSAGYSCTTGHFRAAEFLETHPEDFLLYNSSGLPAVESWSGCHVFDHTKPHVRQYWMDMCLNLTASGVIDGCGADFSATGKNRWYFHNADFIQKWFKLDKETAESWNDGHRQLMVETTKALGDGLLVAKDAAELGDHANAVVHEGCAAGNGTINLLRNLTATSKRLGRRLVYQCHTKRHSVSAMAAFLCGAGDGHYYLIGGWNSMGGHWSEDFDHPLGEPLFECVYNHVSGVWTRVFASGTVVRFNTTSNRGVIEWNDARLSKELR